MVTDPASAVPEPATWAMNFVGLFMIGAALRYWNRRRRALPSRPVPLLRE
ncbi:MAG: PEP-CTERM sorting domain-containing protein [Sphingomonadales bacterium]|nr:PEP-CTERM sorting domain-containing protein [Sphingomonadales bacterium]MBW8752675.1 PEP-CTERM sorting domain-containing protein [Sphingomonadales bacterium]